jgi:hypothetical protein
MPEIPDVDALEDLWLLKLEGVQGVRSVISGGSLGELENSERIFKHPALVTFFSGAEVEEPKVLGHPVFQEGVMRWTVLVVAASMRSPRKGERGTQQMVRAVIEEVDGWEIVDGWIVYVTGFRPVESDDPSVAMHEVTFAHQFDMIGN